MQLVSCWLFDKVHHVMALVSYHVVLLVFPCGLMYQSCGYLTVTCAVYSSNRCHVCLDGHASRDARHINSEF